MPPGPSRTMVSRSSSPPPSPTSSFPTATRTASCPSCCRRRWSTSWIYAEGTCRTRLQSLTCFSEFLMQERPRGTAKAITRKLLIEYLSYLPTRVCVSVRKSHLLNLRNFLETAARERWLPIAAERMIFDEEIPRPPKAQPRYIPAAVLDQLNSRLGNLKTPWMQMALILQECGMRISELLQLPLDCLTQDARGTFYLRFMQGKMKREQIGRAHV